MKTLRNGLVISVLSLFGFLTGAPHVRADVEIDFNTYAAIAYSPSTGAYGYAYNYWSRYSAEREALRRCAAEDAEIVGAGGLARSRHG